MTFKVSKSCKPEKGLLTKQYFYKYNDWAQYIYIFTYIIHMCHAVSPTSEYYSLDWITMTSKYKNLVRVDDGEEDTDSESHWSYEGGEGPASWDIHYPQCGGPHSLL